MTALLRDTSSSTRSTAPGSLDGLIPSWVRSLRAANRSPMTIKSYLAAANGLLAHLEEAGMPTHVASIRREHVEDYLVSMGDRGLKPATVAKRFRSLQQLAKWLADEGEIAESPMKNMKAPQVPVQPVAVLSADDLRSLLATCNQRTFEGRRDAAIIRLFADSQ